MTITVERLWADVFALKFNRPEPCPGKEHWLPLFSLAVESAHRQGARSLLVRLRLEYHPQLFRELLLALGFQKIAGRIEYQCPVDELPDDLGTPLRWKTMSELNWTPQQLAAFLSDVWQGDPGNSEDENPHEFIQDWLHHDELSYGPECIAVGLRSDTPVALVVAQVNQKTGWSRLSYMGLLPEARHRGLGRWVHRHGFGMLRDQGGTLYHGGTHSQNHAMQALFVAHGCRVFCEQEEWRLFVGTAHGKSLNSSE